MTRLPGPRSAASVKAPDEGGSGVIVLNGQDSDVRAGETVAAALSRLGLAVQARGIAVAVDGEVVPRSGWESFALAEGARVEVLTAMQGG